MAHKLASVPTVVHGHFRQQQAAPALPHNEQPVAADLYLVQRVDRAQGREDREFDAQVIDLGA